VLVVIIARPEPLEDGDRLTVLDDVVRRDDGGDDPVHAGGDLHEARHDVGLARTEDATPR